MKIINNQDQIAKEINNLGFEDIESYGDDGNVIVDIKSENEVLINEILGELHSKFINKKVGDGVQEGEIFINCIFLGIHSDLSNISDLIN